MAKIFLGNRWNELPAFDPPVVGKTSKSQALGGLLYDRFVLRISDGGTASANNGQTVRTVDEILDRMIDQITIRNGSDVWRTFKASELNKANSRHNRAGTTSYSAQTSGTKGQSGFQIFLPIFCNELWRGPFGQALAWNIGPTDSLQIDVKWASTTVASPVIDGYYVARPYVPGRTNKQVVRWDREELTLASSTKTFRPNLMDRAFIMSLGFFASSDGKYVDIVEAQINKEDVRGPLPVSVGQVLSITEEMNVDDATVPATFFDLDSSGQIDDALNCVETDSFDVKLTMSASSTGNVPVITEFIKRA